MNHILVVLTVVLIFAGASTPHDPGRWGFLVVSSLGLIALGAAIGRRSRH